MHNQTYKNEEGNVGYKSVVKGKGCIVARVVAYSTTKGGKEIVTFELEYPRFIHGEFMTHRLFSRNAMSSRAVPIEKMIEQVHTNPAIPIHWGKNQSGMQAKEELDMFGKSDAEHKWRWAAEEAADKAMMLNKIGAHKQIVNRILEPYQVMKTVTTTTEIDNFFYLRCHEDAQPEIKELADCMKQAMEECEPELLKDGEWHTPYVNHGRGGSGNLVYNIEHPSGMDYEVLDVEDALKVSASCCAQVSFRSCDDSVDKAKRIYDRLVESKPVHASPFEHQATPIECPHHPRFPDGSMDYGIQEGITHVDLSGYAWSGNFKGWVQYRQLIKDNVYKGENNV